MACNHVKWSWHWQNDAYAGLFLALGGMSAERCGEEVGYVMKGRLLLLTLYTTGMNDKDNVDQGFV